MKKDATSEVYEWYEGRSGTGSYEKMLSYVLGNGGTVINDPEFFVAVVPGGGEVLDVILAYGDMEGIKRYAEYFCETRGYTKLRWSREVAGKHKSEHIYKAKSFYGKLRTTR